MMKACQQNALAAISPGVVSGGTSQWALAFSLGPSERGPLRSPAIPTCRGPPGATHGPYK